MKSNCSYRYLQCTELDCFAALAKTKLAVFASAAKQSSSVQKGSKRNNTAASKFAIAKGFFNPCVVIPVYDHENAIEAVLANVLAHHLHCVLVDDGSSHDCAKKLDALADAEKQKVTLLRLPVNSGKGAAVMAGVEWAGSAGYTHVLQIDADGQHNTADIPRFLAEAKKNLEAVVTGRPLFDASVPKIRLYARYLTHIWVWINTWSCQINDSMCGFRVYPVGAVLKLIAQQKVGRRMNFDTDILVRLHWDGLDIINLPTHVTYPSDGVSHFRVWLDNALITRMHVILFFGMVQRIPVLVARKMRELK